MTVINLAEKRLEREPHEAGTARCMGCKHEWQYVIPYPPDYERLECPECRHDKGERLGTYDLPAGSEVFECKCGRQEFFLQPDKTFFCAGCGTTYYLEDH